MGVPTRYILHQGPVLGALARGAWLAVRSRRGNGARAGEPLAMPGPEERATVAPRPKELVRSYVRHVGGDPSVYRGRLPPHLFPQWMFPLQARALEGVRYPMHRVLNGGCRIEVNAPLPDDEPLQLSCRLEEIDDDGRRAILHERAVTGTASAPDALVTHMFLYVPLAKDDGGGKEKEKKEKPRVPADAREIAFFKIGPKAGLEFAKLTGDFNPVHWAPPYARAAGFRNVILHGYSTLARAWEGLDRHLFAGASDAIRVLDVRFTRPLVLPAEVGLYVTGDRIFVGDAPGGPAYLAGSYEVST